MFKGIIDRFECDLALIEVDGHTVEYPKYLLPAEAEAGDVVIINGNQFTLDKEETKKRKQEMDELINELFED